MFISKKILLSGILALLLIIGTAGVLAAGNEIMACVGPSGQVRIIEAGKNCRPEENLLTWNIQGPQGEKGETGSQGEKGDTGPQGPAGPAGLSGYEIVENNTITELPTIGIGAIAQCPDGKKVLGGGGEADPYNISCIGGTPTWELLASSPWDDSSWYAMLTVRSTDFNCTGSWEYSIYAICAYVED